MNRLQNAQKQLAESLSALESAFEQAQNSTADVDGLDARALPLPAFDIGQLLPDLTAIDAELETAIKMIANLTAPKLSSDQDKDSS